TNACQSRSCHRGGGLNPALPVGVVNDKTRRQVARSPRDRVLRYIGLGLGLLLGWQIASRVAEALDAGESFMWSVFGAAVVAGLLFIIAPYVTVGFFTWLRRKVMGIPAIDIVAAGIGLI